MPLVLTNLEAAILFIHPNKKHSLKNKTLKYATIINQTTKKGVGLLPEKKGHKSKIPVCFWELLNCQISMTQMEGREETKPRHLKALIGAALKNTP